MNTTRRTTAWVADNKVGAPVRRSTYDSAITLAVRSSATRPGSSSYRILNTDTDVVTNTGTFLRTVSNEGTQAYGKLSWQLTSKDRVSGTFTNDPTDISGSTISTTLNTRSSGQKQGGDRYSLEYNRVFNSNFLLDAAAGKHNGEVSTIATIQEILNTVVFKRADNRPLSEQQLGGAGANNISERDTDFYRGSLEGVSTPVWAGHTVKSAWSRKTTSISATAASSVACSTLDRRDLRRSV